MNHDQTFRAVLIVVLLLILPIGIYHRLKSQATREKLDRLWKRIAVKNLKEGEDVTRLLAAETVVQLFLFAD